MDSNKFSKDLKIITDNSQHTGNQGFITAQ
jgi:hypothetical protein